MQASASDNISVVANGLIILEFSVTASPSWSQGSGSLSVRLVNIYAPLIITYASPLGVLAQSPPILFSDPYEPLFPRLSLLGDTNSTLVITWTCSRFTGDERVLLRPSQCNSCQYKDFPLLPGGNITYGIDAMCGGVAKGKGWLFPLFSSCTQTSPSIFLLLNAAQVGWSLAGSSAPRFTASTQAVSTSTCLERRVVCRALWFFVRHPVHLRIFTSIFLGTWVSPLRLRMAFPPV